MGDCGMIIQQKIEAIYKLYPNVIRTVGDIAYDANDNEVSYDAEVIQTYVNSQAYITKRQAEYPNVLDYIDGVVKGDQEQIDAYIAACQAVKTKYPKPE
jgi:hypothetical protein